MLGVKQHIVQCAICRMGSGPDADTAEGIAVGQPVVEVQCAATASRGDTESRVSRPEPAHNAPNKTRLNCMLGSDKRPVQR